MHHPAIVTKHLPDSDWRCLGFIPSGIIIFLVIGAQTSTAWLVGVAL